MLKTVLSALAVTSFLTGSAAFAAEPVANHAKPALTEPADHGISPITEIKEHHDTPTVSVTASKLPAKRSAAAVHTKANNGTH